MVTEERVANLEDALARFVNQTNLVLAAIHEEIAEMRASVAEIQANSARTDRRLLELQQQAEKDREEARRERKDFNKRLAGICESMGTLIEDMVAPCGFQLAKAVFATEEATRCGLRIRGKHPSKPGETMEVDLLATGPTKALVIEAKRRIDAKEAAEYLQKLRRLPEFFPEVQGKTIYPAVASVYLDPSLVMFLNREKIYGAAMGDELMEVVNLGQF